MRDRRSFAWVLLYLSMWSSAPESWAQTPSIPHLAFNVSLNPQTGVVQGSATLNYQPSVANVALIQAVMDKGLSVVSVSAPGHTVAAPTQPYGQYTYIPLQFDPPINSAVTVTVEYRGTLACAREGGTSNCDLGPPSRMTRFAQASAFPFFYGGGLGAKATQELTLKTPVEYSGVVVSAEPVSRTSDATTVTTRWVNAQPLPPTFDVYVGNIETVKVMDEPVKVTAHHQSGDGAWAPKLQSWVPSIIPFLQQYTGKSFPFQNVSLLKLPAYVGEFGHAANSHVCLSNWHGSAKDALFEEEWAHELSHLYWGVSIMPADFDRQRVLSEGLAVLTELDYAHQRFHPTRDRELFLAHRTREAWLMVRYSLGGKTIPPVVASDPKHLPSPQTGAVWWSWAYAKGPATLDFIRVVMGEEAFSRGLKAYVSNCQYKDCTFADFQTALESGKGQSLKELMDDWVRAAHYPELQVSFAQDGADRLRVTLSQRSQARVPVELWVETVDGDRQRHQVTLTGARQDFELPVGKEVRSVRPNPRQDALLWSQSAQAGDINFDGEVDGMDLIHCAWRHGKKVEANFVIGDSLAGVDLHFDPRCDFDGDGRISDSDLTSIKGKFGTGRAAR